MLCFLVFSMLGAVNHSAVIDRPFDDVVNVVLATDPVAKMDATGVVTTVKGGVVRSVGIVVYDIDVEDYGPVDLKCKRTIIISKDSLIIQMVLSERLDEINVLKYEMVVRRCGKGVNVAYKALVSSDHRGQVTINIAIRIRLVQRMKLLKTELRNKKK